MNEPRARASEWLAAQLKDGPKQAGELTAEASLAGISTPTLINAVNDLGIQMRGDQWYLPTDVQRLIGSGRTLPSHERHTLNVVFRLSPRLAVMLNNLAEREQTSVSEVVREALAVRWDLK